MSERLNGYWIIVASLLVAAVLAVLPLTESLIWWRPEWILLVLLYWTIALPHRVGLVTALAVGLLVDVMEGAVLGQNMLCLAVAVTLAGLMYQRLRVFSLLQQASVVFVLAGLHQLLTQWLQSLQGGGVSGFAFLFPALSTALLWPLLMPVLRGLRRSYKVN
ncbi:rod shape-determining protein MreD [Congregibacter variabilis]|uniref:Rod shape-determining protein MreD n=1 Tax=Congregibacter variabilis TaxID=3081200 RepID=A0ABZ0I7G4_9GAMM|nr:rod shape-determining protein MreD [Congregibacter sp. IMCC43200]